MRETEKLVVNALFGEVTVLGFIALVTFFMIKSHMFERLSLQIYGNETHMLHLFEDVHFGLFFTMMLYLLLVIWVLYVQSKAVSKWEDLEFQAREFLREHSVPTAASNPKPSFMARKPIKPPAVPMPRVEYLEWRYNGGGRIPVGFDGVTRDDGGPGPDMELGAGLPTQTPPSEELHQYMLMRQRFIWGCRTGGVGGRRRSDVDQSFDFGKYLENCAAIVMRDVVTVHEVTWVAIALFMLLAYALFSVAGPVGSCFLLTAFGFVLVAGMVYLLIRTRAIHRMLLPPSTANVRQVASGHRSATPAFEDLPAQRNASKHESLFPFGASGPSFLTHFLRTSLLMTAIYAVGLFVVFSQIMIHHSLFILFPVSAFCIVLPLLLLQPVLPRLVVVTSVGQLKRNREIDETLREVKLARSLKVLKVFAALQSQLRRFKKLQSGGARERRRRPLDKRQEADLRDAFNLFDKDGSGTIDSKELHALLQALGQRVSIKEAERLLSEMDVGVRVPGPRPPAPRGPPRGSLHAEEGVRGYGQAADMRPPLGPVPGPPPTPVAQGDGLVSFEEFCDVMADDDEAPAQHPEALAKDMFAMLDKDKSGEISLKEFRELLQSLPIELSAEDIDTMLHEIFGVDDDAAIDEHQFTDFLKSNT